MGLWSMVNTSAEKPRNCLPVRKYRLVPYVSVWVSGDSGRQNEFSVSRFLFLPEVPLPSLHLEPTTKPPKAGERSDSRLHQTA